MVVPFSSDTDASNVISPYKTEYMNGNNVQGYYTKKTEAIDSSLFLYLSIIPESLTLNCVNAWGKLYSSKLFESLSFKIGQFYEDYEIMPKLAKTADKVYYISNSFYHYRSRYSSIMKTPSTQKIKQEIELNRYQYNKLLLPIFRERFFTHMSKGLLHAIQYIQDTNYVSSQLRKFLKIMRGNKIKGNQIGLLRYTFISMLN